MEEEFSIYSKVTEQKETRLIKKIMVVRHAESIANTQGIYQGQTYDTDLSDLGLMQAKALAARMASLRVKRIISSPLKRTYQTALEVSKAVSVPVETNPLILETNHGIWEGKGKEWINKNYPDVHNLWLTRPKETAFPSGETFLDTFDRVSRFLDEVEIDEGTLVVTHDNIVRILVNIAEGLDLNDVWKHTIEPAGLNFFEINKMNGKNRLKTLKLNDNEHLKELRTDLSKHAL